MNRIERITKMEGYLDSSNEVVEKLYEALREYQKAVSNKRRLFDYYSGGYWMSDFEADEAGKLPADLKRGVLSEDAVYDLITKDRETLALMARLVADSIANDVF